MKLHDIRRPRGVNKPAKRVGRGSGSGHGKTSGRGHKGVMARSGATRRLGFEGGQMPLMRRIPKRGFTNVGKKKVQIVNVEDLNRFKKDSVVDKAVLKEQGMIRKSNISVKFLGNGKISKPLNVIADSFSVNAKKKIEEAGGKCELVKK